MKKFVVKLSVMLILMAFCVMPASASGAFDELQNRDDVETVFVSKKLAPRATMPLAAVRRYIGGSLGDLESVMVFNADTVSGIEACKKAMSRFQKDNPSLETLLRSRDEGELTLFCGLPIPDTDNYSMLIVYTEEVDEVSIVVINGVISIQGPSTSPFNYTQPYMPSWNTSVTVI